MNFPSLTILCGIGAGLGLPVVLLVLSHGVWKVRSLSKRFLLATILTSVGWMLVVSRQPTVAVVDLIASAMILLTFILVHFSFWSLLAWGFTLSLLLALARADQPLTFEEWVAAYSCGGSVETFTRDRLSLLLHYRIAWTDGEYVRMTPGRGEHLARLVDLLRRLFGVE